MTCSIIKKQAVSLVSSVVLLLAASISAHSQVDWVRSRSGAGIPTGAIVGGVEFSGPNHNVTLYVCRAAHEGGFHPGKLIAGKCNIPYGGREIEKSQFDVAIGTGYWGKPRTGYAGALVGGEEPGRALYVCRVHYLQFNGLVTIDHGHHPGKVVEGKCNFGFGGKEFDIHTDFEVFYPSERQN